VRTHSSTLGTAIVAWAGCAVFSRLLSAGLYASHAKTTGASQALALLLDVISLGLSAYIVFLLIGEGDYLLAMFAVVFFIGVPFLAVSVRTAQPAESASQAPRGAHIAERRAEVGLRVAEQRREVAQEVASTVARFYEVVFVDSANTRRSAFIGQAVCSGAELLTSAAQSQLAQAFPTSNPGRFACELAVAQGAHQGAFGRPPFNAASCIPVCAGKARNMTGRVSVANNRESAIYQAQNGALFELEHGPPTRYSARGAWLISRFTGRAFSNR
jgi:hypothetical protein